MNGCGHVTHVALLMSTNGVGFANTEATTAGTNFVSVENGDPGDCNTKKDCAQTKHSRCGECGHDRANKSGCKRHPEHGIATSNTTQNEVTQESTCKCSCFIFDIEATGLHLQEDDTVEMCVKVMDEDGTSLDEVFLKQVCPTKRT